MCKRLVEHTRSCVICEDGEPWFSQTHVLYAHRDRTARELVEAYYIHESENVISEPSIDLCTEEILLLNALALENLNFGACA